MRFCRARLRDPQRPAQPLQSHAERNRTRTQLSGLRSGLSHVMFGVTNRSKLSGGIRGSRIWTVSVRPPDHSRTARVNAADRRPAAIQTVGQGPVIVRVGRQAAPKVAQANCPPVARSTACVVSGRSDQSGALSPEHARSSSSGESRPMPERLRAPGQRCLRGRQRPPRLRVRAIPAPTFTNTRL